MNNILAYDEEFILYMYPFLTILFFLKYNHNCISVYYIMLGTNMAIL